MRRQRCHAVESSEPHQRTHIRHKPSDGFEALQPKRGAVVPGKATRHLEGQHYPEQSASEPQGVEA